MLRDRSDSKRTSHGRRVTFINQHKGTAPLSRVYNKSQLVALCEAYHVRISARSNNIIIIFNISIALFTIEDQKRFTKNIYKIINSKRTSHGRRVAFINQHKGTAPLSRVYNKSQLVAIVNQDCVENHFCQIRSCNGQNDNPTFLQQQSTQNSIRLGQTTISTKSNASCSSTNRYMGTSIEGMHRKKESKVTFSF